MNNMIINDMYFNKIQPKDNDIQYLKKCIAEKDEEIKELKIKLNNKQKNIVFSNEKSIFDDRLLKLNAS